MRKIWLIEIEGTPKAVERFDGLLDALATDVSYDEKKVPAVRAMTSWYFPSWRQLKAFIRRFGV